MIANSRYLHASLFSFCVHAAIFLYLYGTFDSNTSQKILISKPLQVELKFESPAPIKQKKIISSSANIAATPSPNKPLDKIYSKPIEASILKDNNLLLQSDFSALLSQEVEAEISKEQQEISMYAQKIISTVENAWMKPRNIPNGLVANLRLNIRPSGRITKVDLIQSSGNIRFDNSAMQAVRRVETFNFFNSLSKALYDKEFATISISFNPSE